jgi:4-hydroxybenzoate polyprenyltransferase
LIFARRFGDLEAWAAAIAISCAYCAVSSAAYLVNDVRDADQDRHHPAKRLRAVARGEVTVHVALFMAAALTVTGIAIGAVLGPRSVAYLLGFAVTQAAYTLWLKRIVLVDVLTIAGLFVLRASAGASAVDVHISGWLLICTALLALFLALAKRRSEIVLVAAEPAPGRPVLRWYSLGMLDVLVGVTALVSVAVYALYATTAQHSIAMAATIPFVAFGVGRYLYLVRDHDLGEEPEEILLADRGILGAVVCWTLASMLALVLGH